MKKCVLLVMLILFIGYNLISSEKKTMTELMLTNVEALADGESIDTPDCISGGDGCYNGFWWPIDREYYW